MNEELYYNQNGVSLSLTQLAVNGKSYTLDNITSTRILETNTWRGFALLSMLLGFLVLIDEGSLFVFGGFLVFAGLLLWHNIGSGYSLFIQTPSGEESVLITRDKLHLESLMLALDIALADNRARLYKQSHPFDTSLPPPDAPQALTL